MLHLLLAALAQTISPVPSASPSPPISSPTPGTLLATPARVDLNPAMQVTVAVSGVTGTLRATLDRKLVTAAVAPVTNVVTITALQATGSDVLHLVDDSGAQLDVPIRVLFNAGTIPKVATLQVTGSPADPAWLAVQVQALVTRLTLPAPGAQTAVASVTPPPSPLPPGAGSQFAVPVTIAGNGLYFDQSDTTTVNVQNVAVDSFLPPLLWYDDDPERVNADGVLYRGTLSMTGPVRLYYYHDDGSDPHRLVLLLAADSQDPTSVQVIDASAGPNIDVMSVGHAVSKNFLLMKSKNEGLILALSDEPYALEDLPMTMKQGVAGNIDLRVLSGGPVSVWVVAASPGVDPRNLLAGPLLPGDGHHRTGIFALSGYAEDRLNYVAGGPDAKLVCAKRDPSLPDVDPASPDHDFGDYGVLRTIVFTISNPTAGVAPAYLYERPIGGDVRSSFLVDGALDEVGCVREPVPYEIAAFALQPGANYQAVVQTMTDGGSNYPLEIGMTATPPQPVAPSISAPDGCFPKAVPLPEPSATPF